MDDAAARRVRHGRGVAKAQLAPQSPVVASLTLAAFVLAAWILVRLDSPSAFSRPVRRKSFAPSSGARSRQLRPAYDMFSARYRKQVSFDVWHEMIVTTGGCFTARSCALEYWLKPDRVQRLKSIFAAPMKENTARDLR